MNVCKRCGDFLEYIYHTMWRCRSCNRWEDVQP